MGDDWQVGDLALCIKRGPWWRMGLKGPRAGCVYTVRAMTVDCFSDLGLMFEDFPDSDFGTGAYSASRFRKIRPHTPDAEDAETIRLLTGAPAKEPVA